MRKSILAACACLLAPVAARAQHVSVGTVMATSVVAGEAQSTVVPPGKNSACPGGRFLVTNDLMRPPQGVVFGRDLAFSSGAMLPSVFDMGTLAWDEDRDKTQYWFGTNDHDLVTLPNGDVLYVTGAFSRVPISSHPGWAENTFRHMQFQDGSVFDFGPAARSVVLVFRSTDCGAHFRFVSEFDPATQEDGSCANPQFRREADFSLITHVPYDMGGSDGQLVKVDPATGRVYLTFQCVGYRRNPRIRPAWILDPAERLNKTLVAVAENRGATWKSLGFMRDRAMWRFGIVPLGGDTVAFGFANTVVYGAPTASGRLAYTEVDAPDPQWFTLSGEASYTATVPAKTTGGLHANVWAFPIITRTPDPATLLLAEPDEFGSQGYGYRVYLVNREANQITEIDSILPERASDRNFVFHLTAIDPVVGPVMLYWYDFDGAAATATIRGRLITSGSEYTHDFLVARARPLLPQQQGTRPRPRLVRLTQNDFWFGDYQTAGGFATLAPQGNRPGAHLLSARFTYFPMWVEEDGLHYVQVEYAFTAILPGSVRVATVPVRPGQWRRHLPPRALRPLPPRIPPVEREPDVRERLVRPELVRQAPRPEVEVRPVRP